MKEREVVRKGKPEDNRKTVRGIGHKTAICLCFKEGVDAEWEVVILQTAFWSRFTGFLL